MMRRAAVAAGLLTLGLGASAVGAAQASPAGDPDPSWSTAPVPGTGCFSPVLTGVVALPGGSTLLGYFCAPPPGGVGSGSSHVARLRPDGTPDPGFGSNGIVGIQSNSLSSAITTSPVVGADGSIFLGGRDGSAGMIVKLGANGAKLAETFVEEAGQVLSLEDLALDPTGGLVGVGRRSASGSSTSNPVVLKVSTDSLGPAPGYGTGAGRTVVSFRSDAVSELANAVAVSATGLAYVVGETNNGDTLVARLTPDGKLDPTFDGNGGRSYDLGGSDAGTDAVLTPAGGLLVGAVAGDDHAVAAISAGSAIDTSFGDLGLRKLAGPGSPSHTSLARATDGRLLAGGTTPAGDSTQGLIGRLTPEGGLDPTFGSAGLRTFDPSPTAFEGKLAVDEFGRALFASFENRSLVVRRFLSDPPSAPPPEQPGPTQPPPAQPPAAVPPATVVPPIVRDTTPPSLRVTLRTVRRAALLRRRHLAVAATVGEPARLSVEVRLVSQRSGRRLPSFAKGRHLSRTTVANVRAGRRLARKIALGPVARKRLRSARRPVLRIRVRATDAAGNTTTVNRTLRL